MSIKTNIILILATITLAALIAYLTVPFMQRLQANRPSMTQEEAMDYLTKEK